jgi:hypothetical protein
MADQLPDPIKTAANALATQVNKIYDQAIRTVLDGALGLGNWTFADVASYGELRQFSAKTEIWWRGRLLGIIHRHEDRESVDHPLTVRCTVTLQAAFPDPKSTEHFLDLTATELERSND